MRTLTFTDEEWVIVEKFAGFVQDPIGAAHVIWDAMQRIATNERPVTGHDTVWLMEHEG